VLFLDEPTTGLDPRSRVDLWDVIAELVRDGTTLLLTTQYLEEADKLADTIAVVDHGRVIAQGSADELKSQVGGERLDLTIGDAAHIDTARSALQHLTGQEPEIDHHTRQLSVPARGGAQTLIEGIRLLDDTDVEVLDIALRRPTLDDVFLSITGKHASEDAENDAR
jgi:ABC-2 type transport system ATP-binding protein